MPICTKTCRENSPRGHHTLLWTTVFRLSAGSRRYTQWQLYIVIFYNYSTPGNRRQYMNGTLSPVATHSRTSEAAVRVHLQICWLLVPLKRINSDPSVCPCVKSLRLKLNCSGKSHEEFNFTFFVLFTIFEFR